jgi:HopA1 effector protein family
VSIYARQLEAAVAATSIHSPSSFAWFGRRVDTLSGRARRGLTAATARSYLVYALQHQLYSDFYCSGSPMPREERPRPYGNLGELRFVEELAAANGGTGTWEGGWTVRRRDGESLVVHRDGLDVWVRPEECRADGDEPQEGEPVRLRMPKGLAKISPGFYVAVGDRELDEAVPVIRFYWHLTEATAVPFVQAATAALNGDRLPFRLKVVNDRARFDRCDAGVVYARKEDYAAASRILAKVRELLGPGLVPSVPALTKLLAPGIGFAEDPATGDSYGLHRCRLVAEGLVGAWEARRRDRLEAVAERFAEEGLDVERPYLGPGCADDYALPLR